MTPFETENMRVEKGSWGQVTITTTGLGEGYEQSESLDREEMKKLVLFLLEVLWK